MIYVRCDRCGTMTSERQRITLSGQCDEQVYKLCIDCRLVVERAVREAIGLHVRVTGAAGAAAQEGVP